MSYMEKYIDLRDVIYADYNSVFTSLYLNETFPLDNGYLLLLNVIQVPCFQTFWILRRLKT